MTARFNMGKKYPEAYKAMDAFDTLVAASGIESWYQELIRIRASQLNGCAYCVDMHVQDALKLGINPRKINVTGVWREAANHFTEEEQIIIRLTEEVTLIHNHGISDDLYNAAITKFGEEYTARIIMAIITINAWNRIGVGLKMQPNF